MDTRGTSALSPACSVPGCGDVSLPPPRWMVRFPKDDQLRNRWMVAIEAGTGQRLAVESIRYGSMVCSWHFDGMANDDAMVVGAEVESMVPTVFIRDNIQLKLVCCQLCFRLDCAQAMFDTRHSFGGEAEGRSLQWMIMKYFGMETNSFICESCVIRVDMTHTFWLEIREGTGRYKTISEKLTRQKMTLLSPGPACEIRISNVTSLADSIANRVDQNEKVQKKKNTDPEENVKSKKIENDLEEKVGKNENDEEKIQPEPYKCTICGRVFRRKTLLNYHRKLHSGLRPYECPTCGVSFAQNSNLRAHMQTVHEGVKLFECSYCNKTFARRSNRTVHEQGHIGIRPYSCRMCPKAYSQKKLLEKHLIVHQRKQMRKQKLCCQKCYTQFKSVGSFRKHESSCSAGSYGGVQIKQDPKDLSGEQEGTLQDVIIKELQQKSSQKRKRQENVKRKKIKNHEEKIQPESYKCTICDRVFKTRRHMKEHRKLHSGLRPYECPTCSVSFAQNKNLQAHIQEVHEGIKPFKCSYCDRAFARRPNLTVHEQRHFGIQPYPCRMCPKSYSQKKLLEKHLIAHQQEKMRKQRLCCQKCNTQFKSVGSFRKHETSCSAESNGVVQIKQASEDLSGEQEGETLREVIIKEEPRFNDLTTDNAGSELQQKSFQKRKRVSKQKNSSQAQYKRTGSFECTSCDKVYTRKDGLKRHEMIHHRKETIAQCKICDEPFASIRRLQDHLVMHRKKKVTVDIKE